MNAISNFTTLPSFFFKNTFQTALPSEVDKITKVASNVLGLLSLLYLGFQCLKKFTTLFEKNNKPHNDSCTARAPLHLFLNFDVNGTLILKDTTKKDEDYMLMCTLTKNTYDQWDSESKRMSFKQYVDNTLVPGDRSSKTLIKERQKAIANFPAWLNQNNHSAADEVQADFQKIKKKFTDETGVVHYSIFPSFYVMLKKLRQMNIPFTIILRSFGNDLQEVVKEIENHPDGIKIKHWAKFEKMKFTFLTSGKTIEKMEEIFDIFLSSDGHFAVQDDWSYWNEDQELSRSGKPYIFDLKGSRKIKNLTLFFDDNITCEEKDIIKICEISNQNISAKSLREKLIFPVNTKEAILDDNYFINRVLNAIHS